MNIVIEAQAESWPLAKPFVISRGSKTQADVVTVSIQYDDFVGHGECVPYARYGETVDGVLTQIEEAAKTISGALDRHALRDSMPAGAARNALDCALWDLEAKAAGKSVFQLLAMKAPTSVPSVQTISLGDADEMGSEAASLAQFAALKIKLDAENILERVGAVRAGAPNSKILIDANESWTLQLLNEVAGQLYDLGVVMIEQPLNAGEDEQLAGYHGPVAVGADESCHTARDLLKLTPFYNYVNIKLDKAGGLTEALQMQAIAREHGLGVMVGSMVSTSLALAPAVVLAVDADYVDLDSPNLLAKDRPFAMELQEGVLSGFDGRLWGGASA